MNDPIQPERCDFVPRSIPVIILISLKITFVNQNLICLDHGFVFKDGL